jgi:hypothetical protein
MILNRQPWVYQRIVMETRMCMQPARSERSAVSITTA